jgi:hypothetical protein
MFIIIILFLLIISIILLGIHNCFLKDYFDNNDNRLHGAVIIEPRNHMALEDVIDNIIINLDVPIIIFHGTENIKLVDNIISKYPNSKFKKYNLNIKNLTITDYNNLLLSNNFWNKSEYFGNRILLVQTDSGICNVDMIKFSLDYDYCGAPWPRKDIIVGNGGFSLRNTKIMKYLIKKYIHLYPLKIKDGQNEDVFFSYFLNKYYSNNICPVNIAKKFSSENKVNKHAFGFHKNYDNCYFSRRIRKKQKLL